MPAGRHKIGFIYGLADADGRIFYVGQTTNIKKRMATYRRGSCHGNLVLQDLVSKHGVNCVILREGLMDLTKAEFEEIGSRDGLANLILSEKQSLRYAKSSKPWEVCGLTLPSTAYMRHVRNAFGVSCEWMKKHLSNLAPNERLEVEKRISRIFSASAIAKPCKLWMEAIDGRA